MEEVKEHPYVLECEAAKPLIVDTFKFMYDLDFLNPQADELTTPPLAMPRLPHEVIFAIGGWSGGTSKGCIETYDTRADRWVTINAEDPAGPRAYHGTAVLGFKIFSIGGYDGVEYFNTCRVFDAVKKKWNEIAPMHCRRCYVSVTELNGMIYAIGGYDGHNRLNTVERPRKKLKADTLDTQLFREQFLPSGDLSRSQFGFRKTRSMVDAVNRVVEVAAQAIEGTIWKGLSKEYCPMVTLDIRNAFNTARCNRIIKALIGFRVPAYLVRIVRTYFSRRVLRCESSEGVFRQHVTGGVPQGSVHRWSPATVGSWPCMTGYSAYRWLVGASS
ncbi:GM13266 [Drosophila sechellia]|uniref:GM13266 n=1 Tax=Drosophila sechellia TaxID=7238 RepID=B4IMH6_DROSE|nr:GM13266 [Drosophila sechellia]